MKKNRRLVWLGVAVLLLVASAGGVAVWLTRPSPYRAAYDRIDLGMDRKAVERVVPELPDQHPEAHVVAALHWEGRIGGQTRRLQLSGGDDPLTHPALSQSRLYHVPAHDGQHEVAPGGTAYTDAAGRVIFTLRNWAGAREELVVFFGPDGVAVEKAYFRFRPGGSWWDAARDFVANWWPF